MTRRRSGIAIPTLVGRVVLATVVSGGLLALPGRPALAWGRVGHRAATKLAESKLNPAARAAIRDLLGPHESLADASNWADEHRRDVPGSTPWHYVNVPITEARYHSRFCHAEGCVVSKIQEYRPILADPHASREKRRQALRFLVHLVEDVHQPLHVGDHRDRGGNDLQLQFFGEGTNLHRIWDSGIIDQVDDSEFAWVQELQRIATPEFEARWAGGTVEVWADESLAAAKDAYQAPETGRTLRKGMKLGDSYQAASLPVVRRRLAQAGVRLAALLNDLWK